MRRLSLVRVAVAGAVLTGVLTLSPVVSAGAVSQSNSNPNNYLALGDSVSFGYNPLLVHPGVNPDVFVGFPQLASDLFRPRLKVFNASCPGETSTSLITGSRPDNGCQDYRQFIGALHVAYIGSQLRYADGYVAANPRTKFVSMMIGANDLFHLANSCQNRPACILSGLPTLLGTLQTNLTTIYSGLRAAGFHGDFVAVTYYSTNYADPLVSGAIELVNGVLAGVTHTFGGKIADGFDAFKAIAAAYGGDSCAAGLLIHRSTTTCDVHPTQLGASLLASAVYAAEGA